MGACVFALAVFSYYESSTPRRRPSALIAHLGLPSARGRNLPCYFEGALQNFGFAFTQAMKVSYNGTIW